MRFCPYFHEQMDLSQAHIHAIRVDHLQRHPITLLVYSGFPHNRENGKSPGIRYWSFTAIKSPGISTFGDLSRELSGKICSLAHPQRHSYVWMLNLVYQLFFARKRLNCSSTMAFVINEQRDKYWGVFIGTGQYHTIDKGSNSNWNRLHIKTKLYRSLEHFFPHVLDYFVQIEGLYITYHEII